MLVLLLASVPVDGFAIIHGTFNLWKALACYSVLPWFLTEKRKRKTIQIMLKLIFGNLYEIVSCMYI